MEKDLVSIIVPVYNAEKFLKDTVDTICNQTYKNWEAIFVDDCSTDSSFEILSKYSKLDGRIKVYKMKSNSGNPSYPRNYGIDKASGDFLCFIDADDKWDNDKIEKQVKFMKENDIAFSYTSYEFADSLCNLTGKKVTAKRKLTYKECLKNNIISTITVMFDLKKISKDLIKMPDLKYVEDTATWWKILRNGYVAYGIEDAYSYYRRIPNSNSSNKFRTLKSLWYLYRKEEKLSLLYATYVFAWKNINAILRRI